MLLQIFQTNTSISRSRIFHHLKRFIPEYRKIIFLDVCSILLTADIPIETDIEIYIFVDNMLYFILKNIENVTRNLQNHLKKIENWTKDNKIKINLNKCSHITFT